MYFENESKSDFFSLTGEGGTGVCVWGGGGRCQQQAEGGSIKKMK